MILIKDFLHKIRFNQQLGMPVVSQITAIRHRKVMLSLTINNTINIEYNVRIARDVEVSNHLDLQQKLLLENNL